MILDLLKMAYNKIKENMAASAEPVLQSVKEEEVKKEEPIQVAPPVATPVKASIRQTISKKGLLELADREGLALTKYLCSAGVQTIGIGITKSDIPDLASWPWDKEITIKEACDMYKKHVQPYANAVTKELKVIIPQHQFDALVSITYNIGIGGMKKSTFMKRLNNRESIQDVVDAIMMWKKPPEIIGRRKKECALFRDGKYTNTDGGVDLIRVNPDTHKPQYKGRVRILEYL